MGTKINWTKALQSSVLEDIESGYTLRQAAELNDISASAIIRRVQADEKFAKRYARALDIRTDTDCDALADRIAESPDSTDHGVDSGWVAWKRVQIDTMKWLLSKRNPKKYGDKIEQFISGPAGGPIQSAITVEFVKSKE